MAENIFGQVVQASVAEEEKAILPTMRGQGIIRVIVVVIVATFFQHSHFLEDL